MNFFTGISSPRQSVSNHALPSAVDVVFRVRSRLNPEGLHEGLTSLTGVWTELLLRDISSPIHPQRQGDCCSKNLNHSECYEVIADSGSCINYYRNVPTMRAHSCRFESREQMNGASGYLDGSDLYGNTDEKLHKLRTYSQGRVDPSACEICKQSGSALGQLYLALLSEHNRIAEKLALENEHWDETKLYLEARRAVVAQIQHVTFNEYVPSVLGEAAHSDPELRPATSGYYSGYSSTNRGGAMDAVALAALQALTSLSSDADSSLEKHLTTSANHVSLDISNQNSAFSNWDTSALLVHTARDHGVPGYVEFVSHCTENNIQVIILKSAILFINFSTELK